MNLIVVTDIFGKTKAFDILLSELAGKYDDIQIVDPYQQKDLDFRDENEAYDYFKSEIGLEKYIELLYSKLQGYEKSNQILLGFSVGASAVWAVSSRLKSFRKTKGICFYSSQVRNLLEVQPEIEIDFYLSKSEPTYEVAEIHSKLSGKSNVTCYITSYLHGFMNQKSKNFNHEGYSRYLKILKLA